MEAAAAGPEKLLRHPAIAAAGENAATGKATAPESFSVVAATAAGFLAVCLGGAALLVWWALAFHPANARLWMVPAGLVLLGTPVLAWLSLCASGPCRRHGGASRAHTPEP